MQPHVQPWICFSRTEIYLKFYLCITRSSSQGVGPPPCGGNGKDRSGGPGSVSGAVQPRPGECFWPMLLELLAGAVVPPWAWCRVCHRNGGGPRSGLVVETYTRTLTTQSTPRLIDLPGVMSRSGCWRRPSGSASGTQAVKRSPKG